MRELAVPRVTDLVSYWHVLRSLLGRKSSPATIAPE